jgi:hypothetical protein
MINNSQANLAALLAHGGTMDNRFPPRILNSNALTDASHNYVRQASRKRRMQKSGINREGGFGLCAFHAIVVNLNA